MEIIKNNLDRIKTPGPNDRVYKDECFYSFDSPESETGLYVCLNRWIGIGQKYLNKYSNRTDNKIFLHIKKTKKVIFLVYRLFSSVFIMSTRRVKNQKGFQKKCQNLL